MHLHQQTCFFNSVFLEINEVNIFLEFKLYYAYLFDLLRLSALTKDLYVKCMLYNYISRIN